MRFLSFIQYTPLLLLVFILIYKLYVYIIDPFMPILTIGDIFLSTLGALIGLFILFKWRNIYTIVGFIGHFAIALYLWGAVLLFLLGPTLL